MTLPPPPKTPNIWKTLAIVLLVVVIILGAIVGILSTNLPSTNQGTGTNNQVQVSGSIQEQNPTEIYFVSFSKTISTSAIITNGQYSVVLVGNQSYAVMVTYQPNDGVYSSTSNSYTIYIPSGVTTFTANF
jgi:hypothetical protein